MKDLVGRFFRSLPSLSGGTSARRGGPDPLAGEVVRMYEAGRFFEATEAGADWWRCSAPVSATGIPRSRRRSTSLAVLMQKQGELEAAEPLFREALDIRWEFLGETHPQYAASLGYLADVLQQRGDLEAAEPLMRRALELRKDAVGETHPDYAAGLTALALLLHRRGELTAAEPLLRQALAIRREALGERHPITATAHSNVGRVLHHRGDLAAAEPLLREALSIRKEALGERHPDTGASLSHLATLLFDRRDYNGAEPLLHEAIEVRSASLGAQHPEVLADRRALESLQRTRAAASSASPAPTQEPSNSTQVKVSEGLPTPMPAPSTASPQAASPPQTNPTPPPKPVASPPQTNPTPPPKPVASPSQTNPTPPPKPVASPPQTNPTPPPKPVATAPASPKVATPIVSTPAPAMPTPAAVTKPAPLRVGLVTSTPAPVKPAPSVVAPPVVAPAPPQPKTSPSLAPAPVVRRAEELAAEARQMAQSFATVAIRLEESARRMRGGLAPDPAVLDEAATLDRAFGRLRDETLRRASAFDIAPPSEAALALPTLATLLDRVATEEVERPRREAARREAMALLDRVGGLRHRIGSASDRLRAVLDAASALCATLAAARPADPPAPEIARLIEGTHPLAELLRLIDPAKLDDAAWSRAYRAVHTAFGPPIAAAAARGRITPAGQSRPQSAPAEPSTGLTNGTLRHATTTAAGRLMGRPSVV